MAVGQRLSLRCFLEGIEVPIISASLSVQMDAPSQCQVQLPATDAILKLKPRTLVHVFYYDFWGGPSEAMTARANEASEEQVATNQDAINALLDEDDDDVGQFVDNLDDAGMNSPNVTSRTTSGTSEDAGVGSTSSSQQAVVPSSGSNSAGPTSGTAPNGETEGLAGSEDPETWKLYFCGEVTAIQFSKSAMSRSVILNCMDNSIYWDTCYQYAANSSANLTGSGQAAFVGAGTTLFDTFFTDNTSTLVNVVKSTPISQPDLKGLLAGVVALLERVGGVYRRGSNNFSGINDFFTIAELRLKLVYQITAASEDFSSQRVFSRRAFHFWGRRQAGRLGKIASFREMVNLMNKFIFHNVVPNPIALYEAPFSEERTRVRTGAIQLSETDRGRRAVDEMDSLISLYTRFARRIRDQELSDVLAEDASTGALVAGGRGYLSRIRALGSLLRSIGAGYTNALVTIAAQHAETVNRDVQTAASSSFDSMVGRRAANGCDACVRNLNAARARFTGEQRNFRRETTTTHHLGNRLNSQIVRPDIYFVSPPRCNVLFPELYSQVNYQRAYMQEVTRMRLTVTDEIFGEDELLNNCYYAPDVAVVGARRRSQLGSGARRRGSSEATSDRTLDHAAYSRRVMDHELYVGIIPMFERMNEVNIYGNRTDTVTHRGARIPYVARAVNHQFFKHRFQPRTLSIQGKFNPSAVCGFPALVLDKHMNADDTRTVTQGYFSQDFFEQLWDAGRQEAQALAEDDSEMAFDAQQQALDEAWNTLRSVTPTQYLGLVAQMNHVVSQQQGATNYSMQYARTHNENEELLGANNVRVARRAPGRSPTRTTIVAALNEPRAGQVGPFHGIITEVEPVNRRGEFLLFGTYSADRPRRQQTRVTVGDTRPAREYGPEVTVLVGDPSIEVTFNAYRVVERIDRWSGQYVDVPLEDFIRPPWMSDIWRNDRIGAVYHQFFGTGAITDPMVVTGGGGQQVPESSVSDEAERQDMTAQARRESVSSADSGPRGMGGETLTPPQLQANPFSQDSGADSLGEADAPSDGSTIQSSLTDITVERAVNLLTRIYSSLKHQGLDVHEFIRAYNWRPVATLPEMLGSDDLEIDERGRVTSGSEGFHSRAFGRDSMGRDLKNLIDPNDTEIRTLLRIRPDNDRDNVLNRLDKRADKAEVVLRYVTELWESRGLLG